MGRTDPSDDDVQAAGVPYINDFEMSDNLRHVTSQIMGQPTAFLDGTHIRHYQNQPTVGGRRTHVIRALTSTSTTAKQSTTTKQSTAKQSTAKQSTTTTRAAATTTKIWQADGLGIDWLRVHWMAPLSLKRQPKVH